MLTAITRFLLFLQNWFINNDIDMYQEESNTPAKVRSHNLNVELAKVFIYLLFIFIFILL